jgi:pyruvate formate lyase activating enzyme
VKKAEIFAIEEFSTYDGPGIRMTVFLKGCPLHCTWCHNPEGQLFEGQVVRSPNGCVGCGACLDASERESGKRELSTASIDACPRGLVRLCGECFSSEKLVSTIKKNSDMLKACGGGVTFSGGEPLARYEFLRECLSLLEGSVHRAVQTCGYSETEKILEIGANCELFLYDLKIMDDATHRRFTGVSNKIILKNYEKLCAKKKNIITRIPLIPSVSDTEENIEKTARFMAQNGQSCVELLPYNKLAGGKYKLVGREYSPEFDESATPEEHRDIFEKYGIEVKVL